MRRSASAFPVSLALAATMLAWASAAHGQAASAVAQGAAPAADQATRFTVLDYAIGGNSVLSQEALEDAVTPFLGEDKTAADIEQARAALEHAYQTAGFQTVAVSLAADAPVAGIVHLRVSESRVGRLRVVNSRYTSLDKVKELAPSLAEDTVPNFAQVQNDIVALNSVPDRTITPSLKAGRDPGTVDVDLLVDEKLPLHASVELNNRQVQGTLPLRVQASASYDNLWQRGHTLSISYQADPENRDDAEVFSGFYTARFPGSDWSLQVNGLHSSSNASVVSSSVVGRGDQIGVQGSLALPGDESFFESLAIGVSYKHFDEFVLLGQSIPSDNGSPAPITYFPFAVNYQGTLKEPDATTDASASLNFSFRGVGSRLRAFDTKRFDSRGDFFYLRGALDRAQTLPLGLVLFGDLEGQVANQPLINNEQFAGGGYDSVRGYYEGELLADNAVRGSVELRSPSAAEWVGPEVSDLRALAFVEGAGLWIREPLPQQQSSFGIISAGVGLRISAFENLNGAFDLAWALKRAVVTRPGAVRSLFRIWAEF